MTFSIIPRDDPEQALRIRRMLLAMSMAVIHLAMCCAMYSQGFFRLSFTGFVLFSVALWVGHFSIFTVVRTGLNKRTSGHHMALLQVNCWPTQGEEAVFPLDIVSEIRRCVDGKPGSIELRGWRSKGFGCQRF
jgi:hypothetical protein